jgi:hypothetical protein
MGFGSFFKKMTHGVGHGIHKMTHAVSKTTRTIVRKVAKPAINAVGKHVLKPVLKTVRQLPIVKPIVGAIQRSPIDDMLKSVGSSVVSNVTHPERTLKTIASTVTHPGRTLNTIASAVMPHDAARPAPRPPPQNAEYALQRAMAQQQQEAALEEQQLVVAAVGLGIVALIVLTR